MELHLEHAPEILIDFDLLFILKMDTSDYQDILLVSEVYPFYEVSAVLTISMVKLVVSIVNIYVGVDVY